MLANSFRCCLTDSNKIYARKSVVSTELPDAIAAREIRKDDSIVFDTGRSTIDLLRPSSKAYAKK